MCVGCIDQLHCSGLSKQSRLCIKAISIWSLLREMSIQVVVYSCLLDESADLGSVGGTREAI